MKCIYSFFLVFLVRSDFFILGCFYRVFSSFSPPPQSFIGFDVLDDESLCTTHSDKKLEENKPAYLNVCKYGCFCKDLYLFAQLLSDCKPPVRL